MATIASIQNLLSKEDCQKILGRSTDLNFQLLSFKITKFNENVSGFLGEHLTLTIKFVANGTTSQTTYFIKTVPQFNLNQKKYVEEAGVLKKELILYQHLLTELNKIGHFSPKCLLIKDNLLVLEDLRARGFKMNPKLLFMKQDHAVAMLKTVAKFHASTLVYESKMGIRINEKFKDEIKETSFSFVKGEVRQKWLVSTTKTVQDLIQLLGVENCDNVCRKFGKFMFEDMELFLTASKKFRNVVNHDDLWCNNILFNDDNDCLLVDFQMTRYAPPCLDFQTAVYLNLDCDYVDNNLVTLIDVYHSSFVEQLQRHNLDSSEFPRSEFEKSLDHYRSAALALIAMYGTHVFISEELSSHIVEDIDRYTEFSFVNRSKYAVKEFQENPEYRRRLAPILVRLARQF